MRHVERPARHLEAHGATPLGHIELTSRVWDCAIDVKGQDDQAHMLQLTLLPAPRDSRGCFIDRWGAQRFEPIGQLFLVPAGHVVHAKTGFLHRERALSCRFRPEAILNWFEGEFEWTDSRLRAAFDPAIRTLLLRLGREIAQPGFASGALTELMMASLAIEVARHCYGITEIRAAGGLSPWRLKLIDERLTSGPSPSLEDLARLCDLSVRQLTRAFRASRGYSLGRHILDSRIDLAKRLLATDSRLTAISSELGFKSSSNFRTAFLRATGETPQEYRCRTGQVTAKPRGVPAPGSAGISSQARSSAAC